MLRQSTRPLNTADKKLLKTQFGYLFVQKKSLNWFTIIVSLLICLVGIPLAIRQGQKDVNLMYLGFGVILAYLFSVLWAHKDNLKWNRREMADYQGALETNQAQVVRCQTTEMVEMVEIEDEGAEYFFQVEENTIFYVSGQEYYESDEFPNTDFELIIILGKEGIPITSHVVCHGQKLKPIRVINEETKMKLLDNPNYPPEEDVFEGKLENLEGLLSNS